VGDEAVGSRIVHESVNWTVQAEWPAPGDWVNHNRARVEVSCVSGLSIQTGGMEAWNRQPLKKQERARTLANAFVAAGYTKVRIYEKYERTKREDIV
jgi:hypothetical protein